MVDCTAWRRENEVNHQLTTVCALLALSLSLSLSLSVLEISLPLSAVDVITDRVQACQTIRTSATV